MALADLTFKLYTDSNLTTEFGGTLAVTHQADLSDNPQDFLLYFGSVAADVQLQTTTNPGVDNITLTPTDILPAWAGTTAYVIGDAVEPVTPNGYRYVVVTAGTTGGSEPTWPTTVGSQVVDGTVVWQLASATHEPTEIKLATTALGLDSATGGALLSLGNTITSGTANKVEVHIRVENTVTTVSDNTGQPEISVDINDVTETAV